VRRAVACCEIKRRERPVERGVSLTGLLADGSANVLFKVMETIRDVLTDLLKAKGAPFPGARGERRVRVLTELARGLPQAAPRIGADACHR
jgi:hypothetical protein